MSEMSALIHYLSEAPGEEVNRVMLARLSGDARIAISDDGPYPIYAIL
jgi:hypothetical protein